MKKLIFFCLVVSMLALPIWAFAIDSVSDVKGYGEQTADFNVGIFDVDSSTTTDTITTTHEWFVYGNQVGTFEPCSGPGCGMIQSKGFDTTSDIISSSTTDLVGTTVQGGADMTVMGGLAACVTAVDTDSIIPLTGTLALDQTQTNNFAVELVSPTYAGSSVTGTAAYDGTTALVLNIGSPSLP
jgi:hypothetical protein